MSAGDIDDTLGSILELERLKMQFQDFQVYWNAIDTLPISRTFHIPYGAGINAKGTIVYVSSDIDPFVNSIDCASALAYHEATEWALRKFCQVGVDYAHDPQGHRLANRAEAERAAKLLSLPVDAAWKLYSKHIDPEVQYDESEPIANVPPDLALYPYPPDLRAKIKAAQ